MSEHNCVLGLGPNDYDENIVGYELNSQFCTYKKRTAPVGLKTRSQIQTWKHLPET